MWIMWIGSLLLTANEVLADVIDVYAMQPTIRMWIFRSLCIVMAIRNIICLEMLNIKVH